MKIGLTIFLSFTLLFIFIQVDAGNAQNDELTNFSKGREADSELEILFSTDVDLDSFIINIMENYHIPGVSACFIKRDVIVWSGNYGYANIEDSLKVSDSTLFVLASISKPVTATALMQLWEKGLFDLDDNINDYLPQNLQVINPWFPNYPITFRLLLSHKSSIDLDWDIINDNLKSNGSDCPVSLDSFLVNYLMPDGNYYWMGPYLEWIPGTNFWYSNPAFGLIGYLVEVIADTPFTDYCRKNIFNPVGMKTAGWLLSDINIDNLATPYKDVGYYFPLAHYGLPYYPAVMLKATAMELARFLRTFIRFGELDGTRILDSTTVDLMWTKHTKIDDSVYYGFGWTFWDFYGAWGHLGDSYGCKTGMDCDPLNGNGVIILTNAESEGRRAIRDKLFEVFTPIEHHEQSNIKKFVLSQNYPNPFNPSTTIEFDLPMTSDITLKIFNILGEEVTMLVSDRLTAGNYTYDWDAPNLASGVYLYRLEAEEFVETKKMILMR
jgi:CubicO group peptidase (beta-lactamase class C family)